MKLTYVAFAALFTATAYASALAAEPGIGADNTHEATSIKDGSGQPPHTYHSTTATGPQSDGTSANSGSKVEQGGTVKQQ